MKKILRYALAFYAITSGYFFVNPHKVHKRERNFTKKFKEDTKNIKHPYVIAHRGGAALGVENTLGNFRRAIEKDKVFMIETDIQLTRDGEVVVFHDRNLARLCEGNWNPKSSSIAKLNHHELPPYRRDQIVLHFGEQKRRILEVDTKEHDLRIPKFQQLLQLLNEPDKRNVWLHVQLKVPSMPLVAKTKELIATYKMENRVIWGCVDDQWNQVLYNANSHLPRNCSKKSVYLIFAGYFFGFIPFLKIKEDTFEIPFYNKNFDEHKKIFEDSWITRIELFLLRLFWILAKPLLWHLQRRGIPCFVFPVNNKVDYLRARGKGVTAVYSDYNNEIL